MKTYILLFVMVVMMMAMAGCEPGTTALISSESFLTSEVRIVQEPAISKIENAKLGVPVPMGCKTVPNNLKSKMIWVVAPMDGVTLMFNKDNRMMHMTITQVAKYSVTCALETALAEFSVTTEGYVEPVDPPAPPAEEPPALDPPVEEPADEPPMWEACTAGETGVGCLGTPTKMTWSQAQQHCVDLREKGYSDWRLPGLHLFMSLLDYSKATAAIDKVQFPRTPLAAFWAREKAVTPGYMWTLRFSEGYTQGAIPTSVQYVRCVRGGLSLETQSFQKVEAQEPTVLDNRTGLKWVGRQSSARFNWAGAQAYCASLTWAGETGWRLPTGPELHSIVDLSEELPAADAQFSGLGNTGESWSSTFRDAGQHQVLDFHYGVLRGQQNTYILPVFCVK